jgi:hypothetical protein
MSATVSPHDATKQEDGIVSRLLGALCNVLAYPFATHGELKWATGILSVDDINCHSSESDHGDVEP